LGIALEIQVGEPPSNLDSYLIKITAENQRRSDHWDWAGWTWNLPWKNRMVSDAHDTPKLPYRRESFTRVLIQDRAIGVGSIRWRLL
jgi:hypothetical protein